MRVKRITLAAMLGKSSRHGDSVFSDPKAETKCGVDQPSSGHGVKWVRVKQYKGGTGRRSHTGHGARGRPHLGLVSPRETQVAANGGAGSHG